MAKRKRKKKLSQPLLLAREEERKLTTGVKYTVRYRIPKGQKGAGHFAKFKANKKLTPEIYITTTRLTPDKKNRIRKTSSLAKTNPLRDRKAKKPITGKTLARIVETKILKRKRPIKNIEAVGLTAEIMYPDRFKKKAAPPLIRTKKEREAFEARNKQAFATAFPPEERKPKRKRKKKGKK